VFFVYLRRELGRRMRHAVFIALTLAAVSPQASQ
jgi:hypothetical protein